MTHQRLFAFAAILIIAASALAQRGTAFRAANVPRTWTVPEPFASSTSACELAGNGQGPLVFFAGNQVHMDLFGDLAPSMFSLRDVPGCPQDLAQYGVDAAMLWDQQSLALFHGREFTIFHLSSPQMSQTYTWEAMPLEWKFVDGATDWLNNEVLLTYGLQYALWDTLGRISARGSLGEWNGWPATWSDGVDDMINDGRGFVHFFRAGQVLVFDLFNGRFTGPPTSISGDPWFDDFFNSRDLTNGFGDPYKELVSSTFLGATCDLVYYDPQWLCSAPTADRRPCRKESPFELRYSRANKHDGAILPYGSTFKSGSSTQGGMQTTMIESHSQFSATSSYSVSAGFKIPGIINGSQSRSYQRVNSEEFKSKRIFMRGEVRSVTGEFTMNLTFQDSGRQCRQRLTDRFREVVQELPFPAIGLRIPVRGRPIDPSLSAYLDLINDFGTHYLKHYQAGALYVELSEVHQDEWRRFNGTKQEFRAQLGLGGVGRNGQENPGVDVSGGSGNESSAGSGLSTGGSRTEYASMGGSCTINGTGPPTLSVSHDNSVPIQTELMPLHTLLNDTMFPLDKDIVRKREILANMIHQYLLDNNVDTVGGTGYFDVDKRGIYEVVPLFFKCLSCDDGGGNDDCEIWGNGAKLNLIGKAGPQEEIIGSSGFIFNQNVESAIIMRRGDQLPLSTFGAAPSWEFVLPDGANPKDVVIRMRGSIWERDADGHHDCAGSVEPFDSEKDLNLGMVAETQWTEWKLSFNGFCGGKNETQGTFELTYKVRRKVL